eukprot:Skav226271  [mRNA]  locus=scaffold2708:303390:311906:- [translate_table: standard]
MVKSHRAESCLAEMERLKMPVNAQILETKFQGDVPAAERWYACMRTPVQGWRPLAGPAEQRLARLANLTVDRLWEHFDRSNLLSWYPGLKQRSKKHDVSKGYKLHTSDGDVFPIKEAQKAAANLDLSQYRSVLLLGNSVARAFGLKGRLFEVQKRGRTRMLAFPHPSGVSHYWFQAQAELS